MNKQLILREQEKIKDISTFSQHEGRVIAMVKGTDKVLFDEWNKVIISGSAFTAMKHFPNMIINDNLPSYNFAIGLDNIVSITNQEKRDSGIVLFAVGIDGCGAENSQIYDVDYTKWIAPEHLVPFRYQLSDNDLDGLKRDLYFGRKENSTTDRIAYYFKAFNSEPVFKQQYVDGTAIDGNVYTSNNKLRAESYVELKMSIEKEDCRDFFIATTGIMDARINTISLLTAYPKIIDGYTYYQNIKPITKLNFSNIPLNDLDLGVDITYQIYY